MSEPYSEALILKHKPCIHRHIGLKKEERDWSHLQGDKTSNTSALFSSSIGRLLTQKEFAWCDQWAFAEYHESYNLSKDSVFDHKNLKVVLTLIAPLRNWSSERTSCHRITEDEEELFNWHKSGHINKITYFNGTKAQSVFVK